MKKLSLLVFSALFLSANGAFAQYNDVTSKYITNPGFESCDALPTEVYHDNQKDVDITKIQLWTNWNMAKGTDYESQGWKLVEPMKNANGGVVTYGVNIQSGQYATAGEPGPASGITGQKGLCFCGAAGLIYQQASEITLPAGTYRLTVNLYARNGQTTNPGPTQQVNNIKTGFMPTGGTEDNLIPAKRSSQQFKSNDWDQDVLAIELTAPTKGRFQISYGSSYFVVVDDIKLEFQGGVITTALENIIPKAEALNAELNSTTLAAAIQTAKDFVANPTSQDDVTPQVQALTNAMKTALAASTTAVNITGAYLENASFETGKSAPWTVAGGTAQEPTNEKSKPYIDGKMVLEFAQAASNSMTLKLTNMPAGYYLMDARLNNNATFKIANVNGVTTGGVEALYIRNVAGPVQVAEGDLELKIWANTAFRIDDIRLFYAKDNGELLSAVNLAAIKEGAQAILNDNEFANVTGDERTDLADALKGNDGAAINEKLNAFFKAKEAYDDLVKAKESAALFNKEVYPYATATTLQQIQTIINTSPATRAQANELTTQLTNATKLVVIENAYCDGVNKNDLTSKIAGAHAQGTTLNTAWTANNVTIRTLVAGKAWTTREGGKDNVVYGTTEAYNSDKKDETSSLQQTVKGLPAGKYVLSATMAAKKDLPIVIRINNVKNTTFTGLGTMTSSATWAEVVASFEKADNADLTIRFEEATEVTYKEWFVDNIRLYQLLDGEPTPDGIRTIQSRQRDTQNYFDLSGRRVAQPAKGLYIVDGKKVIIK